MHSDLTDHDVKDAAPTVNRTCLAVANTPSSAAESARGLVMKKTLFQVEIKRQGLKGGAP
jgi:hypothetical protein